MKLVLILTNLMLRLLNCLPLRILRILGVVLGSIGYYCIYERRRVGEINLSLCFPEMTKDEKHKILKAHFCHLVTGALCYGMVCYGSKQKLQKIVQLKNRHFIDEYYDKLPVILLCPHFVGLDLAALRMTTEYVGFSIYSRQKNENLTKIICDARLRFIKDKGGEVFARQDGLRPIVRKLRQEKHIFYYLPDQDFGAKDSLFVPFFAYPNCATISVLPKIVELSNAIVVPCAVYANGDGYVMEFFAPWRDYPSSDLSRDVITMNKFIESVVSEHIEEYFWLHKRFKTEPGIKERGLIYKDK